MLSHKSQKPSSDYINNDCVTIQHEDNYHLLNLLLPKPLNKCQFNSDLANKPILIVKVINKFKYTTEIEFDYAFNSHKREKICIKLYHDAQVAEMVSCTDVHQFIRLLGPKIPVKIHMKTRYALNTFLNKWLNFLINKGYNYSNWKINNLKIR